MNYYDELPDFTRYQQLPRRAAVNLDHFKPKPKPAADLFAGMSDLTMSQKMQLLANMPDQVLDL